MSNYKKEEYNRWVKGKYFFDKADLAQTIILISGLTVASVFSIAVVGTVTMDKGEKAATCISNKDFFNPAAGSDFKNNCDSGLNGENVENAENVTTPPTNNNNNNGGNNKYENIEEIEQQVQRNIVDVISGYNHNFALADDGTLWGWGVGDNGELGTGNVNIEHSPVQVRAGEQKDEHGGEFLTNITQVSAGMNYTLAIDDKGQVWSWGYSRVGRSGISNETKIYPTPVKVRSLENVNIISVRAGESFSVALDDNGNVWTWGANYYGQLGTSEPTNDHSYHRSTPQKAHGGEQGGQYLENISYISPIREGTVYVIDKNGNVYGWGSNNFGQLAIYQKLTDNAHFNTPVKINGGEQGTEQLGNIVKIVNGKLHVLALDKNGNVWSWGSNQDDGRLGQGHFTSFRKDSYIPKKVVGGEQGTPYLTNIVDIATNEKNGYALDNNGTIWAWGDGATGDLANGIIYPIKKSAVAHPVKASLITDEITKFSAGSLNGAHLALSKNGEIWSWNSDFFGTRGDGTQNTGMFTVSKVITEHITNQENTENTENTNNE